MTDKPPVDAAVLEAARADEERVYILARLRYLEERVVALNVEIRVRDQRLAELTAESNAETGGQA